MPSLPSSCAVVRGGGQCGVSAASGKLQREQSRLHAAWRSRRGGVTTADLWCPPQLTHPPHGCRCRWCRHPHGWPAWWSTGQAAVASQERGCVVNMCVRTARGREADRSGAGGWWRAVKERGAGAGCVVCDALRQAGAGTARPAGYMMPTSGANRSADKGGPAGSVCAACREMGWRSIGGQPWGWQ